MTEFKSTPVEISSRAESIFTFLDDFNNFEVLLPEQVTDWQATKDSCSFVIQGMANLKLLKGSKTDFSYISYISDGKKPFEFSLHFHLDENSENRTNTHIVFKAALNPMLKMMASRPLQNLVNIIAEKLKEKMEQGS